MTERLLLHPRNCLIFHLSGRLFYNLAHSCSHPCSPRPSLPSRPVFHAASSSSSLALVSCRPVHSILSRSFSLSHVYVYTLSLLLAQPPHSLFARLLLSLSLSLCLLDAIPLLLSYFRALYMLVPILLPVPTSSACSPSCRNTPTCHVVVWVHVHKVSHSGTRPTATATECGCGVPTELRVQTTVPRTHHSVPHSCLAFSRDRSPAGILSSIHPIDASRAHPQG